VGSDGLASATRLRSARAGSFGAAASVYERARPIYPDAAVDWLIPHHKAKVVDLGAGTGKLTRMIVQRGVDVTAVEPSEGMLEQLRKTLPGIPAVLGRAEQIPLETSSVDAVLVAQAWHWVDVPHASVEVARVLKPGGRLGLIWNTRDERVDWVRELSEIRGKDPEAVDRANPDFGEPFGQIEYLVTEWHTRMTRAGLLELIASRSDYIIASKAKQAAARAEVEDLLDHHPQLAGRDSFDMPYVTYASRAHVT
jgi:ubiquinone/menaquinone biosynthesis C-methylase UbiE